MIWTQVNRCYRRLWHRRMLEYLHQGCRFYYQLNLRCCQNLKLLCCHGHINSFWLHFCSENTSYRRRVHDLKHLVHFPNFLRLHPPPFPPLRGTLACWRKRQPENIQIIEKKKKTLTISKQINKAMTKQYIYIYRYKKERKMCNDSSIIFTQMFTSL